MKKFIQSLELRWSDLLLLVSFVAFIPFLMFGQEYMQSQDPTTVPLPLWLSIVSSIIMIGCGAGYLYLELAVRKTKVNQYVAFIFLALALLNLITIFIQPEDEFTTNIIRWVSPESTRVVGESEPVHLIVTPLHKFVFSMEMIGAGFFPFVGLFVFPKRFKNIKFLEYVGYALYALVFVMIFYSYITEYNIYIAFIKNVLGLDKSTELMYLRVQSFILHPNAFGMVCMLGIIFCFINQSIRPKLFNYIFAGYFFISMIFSLCKTGLLLSALIILAWYIYRLIVTYKEHTKRNKIAIIITAIVLVLGLALVGIPYLTKGKVLGKVYDLIKSVTGEGLSMKLRGYIWDNCYQLISNGWWVIGRGFGVINLLLKPMNVVSHEEVVFPTHSSFLNMLTEGGIVFLIAYFAFIIYIGYVTVKSYKKSPQFIFAVALGAGAFFLYSFIETIHYLMVIFLFPIFVIYFQNEESKVELCENTQNSD